MEWARPLFAINHPPIIVPPSTQTIILMVFEDLEEQFMESKYIMNLGELLQLTLDLETYFKTLLKFLVFQTKNFGKEN
jgi:hypothetical protein